MEYLLTWMEYLMWVNVMILAAAIWLAITLTDK